MAKKPTYEKLEQRVKELEKENVKLRRLKEKLEQGTEETLRESEEKYRNIFNNSGEGIVVIKDGTANFVNHRMLEMLGFSRKDIARLNNESFLNLIHPDDRKLVIDRYERRIKGEELPSTYSVRLIRDDGEFIWVDLSPTFITWEGNPATLTFVTDITERKKSEEEVQKLASVVRYSNELVNLSTLEGKMIFLNEAGGEMLGIDPDEIGQVNIMEVIPEHWTELVQNKLLPALMEGRTWKGELQYRNLKTGELTDVHAMTFTVKEPNTGKPLYLANVSYDNTERKKAEKALRESEEKYRILFEKANIAISVVQDGIVKSPNPKLLDLHGYSEEEITSTPFTHFIHPEDREMVQERHERRCRGEELPDIYSYRILNKAGETKWVELNVVPILWEGKSAVLCFLIDITDQKHAEEERKKFEVQFQQAQRMESLGTLAGGIAHNFNNVLMGIQGRTSLMMLDKDDSHSDFEHLKGIEEYVKNAVEMTKDLLGFARSGKYEPKPVDMNELVKHENLMFGRTKKEITIHGKYDQNLWTVEADQGQVQQVFMNLYVNAWQAMPGGGDLYIQTENAMLDENYVKSFEITPGKYVKISVTDTGVGMDKATIEKIFDPFFTTQEVGAGTGLGLASVYGIVKNHGGFINAYSEKGHGTTFNIYLPASEKEAVEEKKMTRELVKGEGTILLVDDEEMITTVGKQLLEELGYRVLIAKNGKEAIGLYEKSMDDINLVILDMIMPDMNGGETFDRLKEIDPAIKVLLSSGYSINGQAQEILDRGCNGFIQKPFDLKDISMIIMKILDSG